MRHPVSKKCSSDEHSFHPNGGSLPFLSVKSLLFLYFMHSEDAVRYKILKLLENNPHVNQRDLALDMGISLGKLNYCLRALITAGWVKGARFCQSSNKKRYAYFLTPQGFEAKARLGVRFLQYKMTEFDTLKKEIEALQLEMSRSNPSYESE